MKLTVSSLFNIGYGNNETIWAAKSSADKPKMIKALPFRIGNAIHSIRKHTEKFIKLAGASLLIYIFHQNRKAFFNPICF